VHFLLALKTAPVSRNLFISNTYASIASTDLDLEQNQHVKMMGQVVW
jgi:hypothetical protein